MSNSTPKLISPFKKYYFDNNLQTHKTKYLQFLSGLRVFVQAIRNHKTTNTLLVKDIVEFVNLHKRNDLKLIDNSSFNTQKSAVNLLTAHKAKGLEFDTVFVINCTKKEWQGRGAPHKLNLPSNLPLLAERDDDDDNLRLFYVALTRAKNNLILTSFDVDDDNKEMLDCDFLSSEILDNLSNNNLDKPGEREDKTETLTNYLEINSSTDDLLQINKNEKDILQPILENYKLSITHLANFLDITRGGPETFLEQNLLRFPQTKNNSSSFGSAMHLALCNFYNYFKQTNQLPNVEFLLEKYEEALWSQGLGQQDFEQLLDKGKQKLSNYYNLNLDRFDIAHLLEFDFKNQQVHLGEAKVTGKIDKIVLDRTNKKILVVDYKTGKAASSWKGESDADKIKLWKYKQQLIFYKLLVENCREFGGHYQVKSGALEFLEADRDYILPTDILEEEAQRLNKLVQIVYQKIINLELPDIQKYQKNLQGILQFEEELLGEEI